MSVKQISVFLENRAGALETKDFGIVRIIVDDVYEATTVLKEAGYVHTLTPVVVIAIPDEPGGLNRILKVFTKAGVNIEYMYAFLGGADAKHAYMVFRPDDTKAAALAATSAGMRLVDQEDICRL